MIKNKTKIENFIRNEKIVVFSDFPDFESPDPGIRKGAKASKKRILFLFIVFFLTLFFYKGIDFNQARAISYFKTGADQLPEPIFLQDNQLFQHFFYPSARYRYP